MTGRLTGAIADFRHASYITHPLRDLLTQRVFQNASGYEEGNDATPCVVTRYSSWPLDTDNLLATFL